MKKLRLITSVFLLSALCSLNLSAQEMQRIDTAKWLCTYKYEFQQDSTSKQLLKQIQMVLQVGKHLSKFCDLNHFFTDSILSSNYIDDEISFNRMIKSVRGIKTSQLANNLVYKNYPLTGEYFFTAYGDHEFFKVVQPMQMKWKLEATKDTLIVGYHCKKATTKFAGRDYIAWYTTQIPVSEGPYKFNGLPGLIVKINDIKNEHQFTLSTVKQLKYEQAITLAKLNYIGITPREYVVVLKNSINKMLELVQSGGLNLNEEAKARSSRGLKSLNNFIEKY